MPIRRHPHPPVSRLHFQINGFPTISRTANSISSTSPCMGSSTAVPRPRVKHSLCRRGARNDFVPRRSPRATAGVRSARGGGLGGSPRSPHQGMRTGKRSCVSRGREARCVWCVRAQAASKRGALPHATIMSHASPGGVQGQASEIARHARAMLRLREGCNDSFVRYTGQFKPTVAEETERDESREMPGVVVFSRWRYAIRYG